jgi:hypothetical protein
MRLDRRDLLRGAFGLPLVGATPGSAPTTRGAAEDGASRRPAGMIARQKHPENLEFPFSALEGFLTPVEQFFVRSHFEVPEREPSGWRVSVEGEVAHPLKRVPDLRDAAIHHVLPIEVEVR